MLKVSGLNKYKCIVGDWRMPLSGEFNERAISIKLIIMQGQCFFIGLSCSIPTIVFSSLSLSLLSVYLSIGWYYGAGVFGLIGCISLSPSLALLTFFNNNNNDEVWEAVNQFESDKYPRSGWISSGVFKERLYGIVRM